jgi:hypothetical protein
MNTHMNLEKTDILKDFLVAEFMRRGHTALERWVKSYGQLFDVLGIDVEHVPFNDLRKLLLPRSLSTEAKADDDE